MKILKLVVLSTALLGIACHNEHGTAEHSAPSPAPVTQKNSQPEPGHVLVAKNIMSRDFTYISFAHKKEAYIGKAEVGGEQISYTKIIAFAGEQYQIEVAPDPNLDLSVSGRGVNVEDITDGFKKRVTVNEDTTETFIEISLTSHPDSTTYSLTVTQLR